MIKAIPFDDNISAIRVGYFVDCFPAISETFVLNEIMELTKRGFEVVVFSLERPSVEAKHPGAQEWAEKTHYVASLLPGKKNRQMVRRIKDKLADWFRGSAFRAHLPPPYNWISTHASALINEVRDAGCQRLHAHFAGPACQWAFIVARMINIPFSFTAHRYDIFERPPEEFHLLMSAASACVTVSEYNRRYLIEKYGKVAEKFAVIACGTDTHAFYPKPSEPRIVGQILTVGRLSPEKGYQYLLEAASILEMEGVDYQWLIVGEGAERRFIENSIHERKLQGKVSLLGALASTEIRQLMRSSELFVLSSINEGAPVAYMEAMSSATPIVGTDVMGVSEILLDGKTGVLVPPADPAALARRIRELLLDEVARSRMGMAGRAHALKNLSLSRQVDKLLQLWGHAKIQGDISTVTHRAQKANR